MTYTKESYERNKASITAAKKRYYEKHREKILQKQKEYDRAHSEERKEKYMASKLEKADKDL